MGEAQESGVAWIRRTIKFLRLKVKGGQGTSEMNELTPADLEDAESHCEACPGNTFSTGSG